MSLLSLPPFANLSPARQKAIYSDFSEQRTTNPPGFKANVAWWSSLLLLASDRGALPSTSTDDPVKAGGGLVLDVGEDLLESLRVPGGGRPLALGTVIVSSTSRLTPSSCILSSGPYLPCTLTSADWKFYLVIRTSSSRNQRSSQWRRTCPRARARRPRSPSEWPPPCSSHRWSGRFASLACRGVLRAPRRSWRG